MGSQRCQICGISLSANSQCTMKYPETLDLPSHCKRCHWEARGEAEKTFIGPILPPPWAESIPERPGLWVENPGQPLEDKK